jgi:hypothetical protein
MSNEGLLAPVAVGAGCYMVTTCFTGLVGHGVKETCICLSDSARRPETAYELVDAPSEASQARLATEYASRSDEHAAVRISNLLCTD